MRETYLSIIIYTCFVIVSGVAVLLISHLLGPRRHTQHKFDPYECGVPMLDSTHKRFSVKFYLLATLFILLDIETVFLVPWSVMYKDAGIIGFGYVFAFLMVLTFGFIYVWRRGALEWD